MPIVMTANELVVTPERALGSGCLLVALHNSSTAGLTRPIGFMFDLLKTHVDQRTAEIVGARWHRVTDSKESHLPLEADMPPVSTHTEAELRERRAYLLEQVGISDERLHLLGSRYQLSPEAAAILREIDDIDYLLGK